MTDVVLGIDLGTGSTKAALVAASGRVLATARAPHAVVTPRPGWSESDPQEWLRSTASAVRGLSASIQTHEVVAIGLSGQMHGVTLCTRSGLPVRNAVLWSDQRSLSDVSRLQSSLEPILPRLANPLVAGMAGPTLAALRRLEPDALARADLALQPKDWLRMHLTGEVATDPSDASATLLWDVEDDDWSAPACTAFGVDPGWLPQVRPSGAVAGHLNNLGAELLGLPMGVPVATGAADTAAALLGAGLRACEVQVSTGTGGQIARVLSHPAPDPTRRTHLYRTARTHEWYVMAAIQNAGIAIEWALGVLDVTLDEATQAIGESPLGSNGAVFVPYLTGERTPHLDAALTARWVNLRNGTSRADLVRSVFEGVACALRDGLDALRVAGHTIDRALLAGGGSTARWWQQMLSDVMGIPLVPHDVPDASARGAGLLGWASVDHIIESAAEIHRFEALEPEADPGRLLERYRAASSR